MAQNPWAVESLQSFYYLKCPECNYDTKEEKLFENHATENHPLSLVLFDKKSVKKDFDTIDIKEEPSDQSNLLRGIVNCSDIRHGSFCCLTLVDEVPVFFIFI